MNENVCLAMWTEADDDDPYVHKLVNELQISFRLRFFWNLVKNLRRFVINIEGNYLYRNFDARIEMDNDTVVGNHPSHSHPSAFHLRIGGNSDSA